MIYMGNKPVKLTPGTLYDGYDKTIHGYVQELQYTHISQSWNIIYIVK